MNQLSIYPKELGMFIAKARYKYIPRKLKYDEHLRIFKRYWLGEDRFVKVDQIYTVNGNEYYEYHSVKQADQFITGVTTYPLNNDITHELIPNKVLINKIGNIINSNTAYSGAEIKFWFFSRKIDITSEKYNGFISYIDPNSLSLISDNKFYYVRASQDEKGNYYDCRVALDRSDWKLKSRKGE